jgi:hypothetical protein
MVAGVFLKHNIMTIETLILILTGVFLFLHIGIGIYVTNKTAQVAVMQEEVCNIRTQIRERHSNIVIQCNSIEHMHKAVTDDRVEILRTYYKIKEYYETTQKTSSCQYKYEYTNSTV